MWKYKLFKENYPIKSEDVLQRFIKNNRNRLKIILQCEIKRFEYYNFQLEYKYFQQLKNDISFWGNIKPKNIIHNEYILKKKECDGKFDEINDRQEIINNIQEKFEHGECVNIYEINEILKMGKWQDMDDILPFINAILGVGFVLFIWWLSKGYIKPL